MRFGASGTVPRGDNRQITPQEVNELGLEIELLPSEREHVDATLLIRLPGRPEEYEMLAGQLATDIAQYLAFYYEDLRLWGGLRASKRIPETPQEQEEVGGTPYLIHVNLQEVGEPLAFDPNH